MPKDEPQYEVGYGRPPRGGQFSEGQVGKPERSTKGFEESGHHRVAGEPPAGSGERFARHPHGHQTRGDGNAIGE